MFQNTVKGIDKIFQTNNYQKLTILVTGYAGTLKSTFVYATMSKYLEQHPNKIAMYATMEQQKESLLSNIKNIGIKECDSVHVADYNRTRDMYKNESESADFLDLIERLIVSTKEEHGADFCLFALDSINAHTYRLQIFKEHAVELIHPRSAEPCDQRRMRFCHVFRGLVKPGSNQTPFRGLVAQARPGE